MRQPMGPRMRIGEIRSYRIWLIMHNELSIRRLARRPT